MGVELAEHNIQVNGIASGFTRTNILPFVQEKLGPVIESIEARVPIHRITEPDEYKGIAAFLASSASDLMTGHTVAVDGGYVAW